MNCKNNELGDFQILSLDELLKIDNLIIPDYQRPYKWSEKNVSDLILDINHSIEESKKYHNFKYRIGTILLHKEVKDNNEDVIQYNIIDGQQRILTLLLIKLYLLQNEAPQKDLFRSSSKITQYNLKNNYRIIKEWFANNAEIYKTEFKAAFASVLEVVVIVVDKIEEAFQLFDSQNSRGRSLYPHDLLKAYHLREIKNNYTSKYAVLKWENNNPEDIRDLFNYYLFPLLNWAQGRGTWDFSESDIDQYKGIEVTSDYNYAYRAQEAFPYFQITEPFIAGAPFFDMVEHYLRVLHDIKEEIITNESFSKIKEILINPNGTEDKNTENTKDKNNKYEAIDTVEKFDNCRHSSRGFNYAKNLFFCALLIYYDRFHNFDVMAVKKIFLWAMMIRVDMQQLGFATINCYAIGDVTKNYSNNIDLISKIVHARKHTEISYLKINVVQNKNGNWDSLYQSLNDLN